jgi:hypothetical protein
MTGTISNERAIKRQGFNENLGNVHHQRGRGALHNFFVSYFLW